MLRAAAAFATSLAISSFATLAHADNDEPVNVNVAPAPPAPIAVTSASQVIILTPATAPVAPPDDGLPATVPGAPQNEAWSNVSHINGVPVPVGERNRYLYETKHWNLAVNPIGLVIGYYEGAVSHALGNNVAVSVELAGESHDGSSAQQLALTLPIYFKKVFTGPFIEPGFVLRSETDGDDSYDGISSSSSSTSMVQFEMMVGWSWLFDNGLNMSVAGGLARQIGNNNGDQDLSEEIAPAGYFRVGYAF